MKGSGTASPKPARRHPTGHAAATPTSDGVFASSRSSIKTLALILASCLAGALIAISLPSWTCRHGETLSKLSPLAVKFFRALSPHCPSAQSSASVEADGHHPQSALKEETAQAADQAPKVHAGQLRLVAAGHCIKKDTSKSAHECGEDAFAVSLAAGAPRAGRSFLGVADGVGGWTESGGDSSKVSTGFLREMTDLVRSSDMSLSEISLHAFGKLATSGENHRQGSTTLCTALFDHREGLLYISNIGDSGAFLLREGKIIFKTKLGVEGFNAPHQVGFDQLGRPYGSIKLMETRHSVPLRPGDILVIVTDGVLDNLYDQEIAELVTAMVGPVASGVVHGRVSPLAQLTVALQERIKSAATTLAWHSWARSQEAHWRSPFADSAISHGYMFSGG